MSQAEKFKFNKAEGKTSAEAPVTEVPVAEAKAPVADADLAESASEPQDKFPIIPAGPEAPVAAKTALVQAAPADSKVKMVRVRALMKGFHSTQKFRIEVGDEFYVPETEVSKRWMEVVK